jgi:hypothetical protein
MQAIQTMVHTVPKNLAMLIHHIKPEQIAELERMFAKKTRSGSEIPNWLLSLRQTPTQPAVEATDFESTTPAAVAEQVGA